MKWLLKLRDDRGSLSIVIIGLFVITVASLMIMTDVATVMVAKRSLTQATEAAAMRGVHTNWELPLLPLALQLVCAV